MILLKSAISAYKAWIFLFGYLQLSQAEVVYLCFDSSPSSVEISCSDDKRIKVVESLYVRSQWDACFYQYGAGDCSQKTDIGFDCCGESSCKVEAMKAYLPACGYSTLLRVVYECVSESYSVLCGKEALNDAAIAIPYGKSYPKTKNKKRSGETASDNLEISSKENHHHSIRHGLKTKINVHRQRKVYRNRSQSTLAGNKLARPRQAGPSSSDRTAYGLLGSGIIIIVGLSGLLVFLWWRRRQLTKATRFIPPSVKCDTSQTHTETEIKASPTTGNTNRGYESDIMVSVLPEAPPRRKRKRHFPSFLGIKESRESHRRGPPAAGSLQDYDGESLSDSGTEMSNTQRNKGRNKKLSDLRPHDYSHDIERLQKNFVTRVAKVQPTTEI